MICCASRSSFTREDLLEALKDGVTSVPNLFFLEDNNEGEMLDIFAESFLNDPMTTWVTGLTDDNERKAELQFIFNRSIMGWANRPILVRKKGIVVGIRTDKSKMVGAVSIMPSKYGNFTFLDILSNIFNIGAPPVYTSDKINYDVDAAKRFDCLNTLEKKRKHIMKNYKDYLYIQTIGVLGAYQGKGYGGKLLRALLLAADSIQMPLYLETESEENESLYQHFGFKTIENVILSVDESSLKMYLMKRA